MKYNMEITKTVVTKEIQEVTLDNILGIRLKNLRLKRGLSLEDLAKKSSYSKAHIKNLEYGNFHITIRGLERICIALRCKSSDILPF